MTNWINACKQYSESKNGGKYLVPKKGTDAYNEIKALADAMPKYVRKEKPKPEVVVKEVVTKQVKETVGIVLPPVKKTKKAKGEIVDPDFIRRQIRNEILAEIEKNGLIGLSVDD